MSRNRKVPVTLPAVFDTGSAKLKVEPSGQFGIVYVRNADGAQFRLRTTDQQAYRTGVLQTVPSPIEVAYDRHRLLEEEYRAGRAYRTSYDLGLGPSVGSIDLNRDSSSAVGSGIPFTEEQAFALRTWRQASMTIRASLGQEFLDILTSVVIDEFPARMAAEKHGFPRRAGFKMLRRCLCKLAVFYGFATTVESLELKTRARDEKGSGK